MSTDITDNTREFLDLMQQLRDAKAEIKELKAEVAKSQARTSVAVAALKNGVLPKLLDDFMGRIDKAGWTVRDDKVVMPGSAVGPDEWVKSLRSKAEHFFRDPDQGALTDNSGNQSGGGKVVPTDRRNPWSREGWDDMAQAAAYRKDPEEAEALAKAAGSRIGALRPA